MVVFLMMARLPPQPRCSFALADPPLSLGPAASGLFPSPQEERKRHLCRKECVFSRGRRSLEP